MVVNRYVAEYGLTKIMAHSNASEHCNSLLSVIELLSDENRTTFYKLLQDKVRFRAAFASLLKSHKETLVLVTDKPEQVYNTLEGILSNPFFFCLSEPAQYATIIIEAPNAVFDALATLLKDTPSFEDYEAAAVRSTSSTLPPSISIRGTHSLSLARARDGSLPLFLSQTQAIQEFENYVKSKSSKSSADSIKEQVTFFSALVQKLSLSVAPRSLGSELIDFLTMPGNEAATDPRTLQVIEELSTHLPHLFLDHVPRLLKSIQPPLEYTILKIIANARCNVHVGSATLTNSFKHKLNDLCLDSEPRIAKVAASALISLLAPKHKDLSRLAEV